MICTWCREEIAFDASKCCIAGEWRHTRCENEALAIRAELAEEYDAGEASLMSRRTAKPAFSRSEVINYGNTSKSSAREIVDFPANTPVTVALKYIQGKTISNQYGERILFSLADGRIMFLDPEVAGNIEKLGINVRENFSITRRWDGQKGSWEVARVAGEQPNGTLVVAVPPKPASSAATPVNRAQKSAGSPLVEEAQTLVDTYAAVREYARETYGGQIKSAEIRTFVTTAYIQRGRSAA